MNRAEDITVYKDPNNPQPSPNLARRTLGCSYDFPEKSPKKEKKWSISNLFRRKKKDESESSSGDESQKKGFLSRRKKRQESHRKKLVKSVGTFDHVVIPPVPRNSLIHNGYNDDNGVLSDPTGGFSTYVRKTLPQIPLVESKQKFSEASSNDINNSIISLGSGSVESVSRKSRREQAKARAEARRTSSRNGNSSEEDSQKSNSSLQIRSEENLRQREMPSSRKSRAARTERYLKRHSKDGENPHNYLRLSKSDAEHSTINWKLADERNRSPSRSPLVPSPLAQSDAKNKLSYSSLNSQSTSISGLSTIPPSHASQNKYRISNSTSNPSYKPPQSMNDYHNSTKKFVDLNQFFPDQRSISCDANIHKAPSSELAEDVLHIQFPIMRPNCGYRKVTLIDASHFNKVKQPPPPPPRDPSRMIGSYYLEKGRPNTYYFDNTAQAKSKSFSNSHPHPGIQHMKQYNSFNLHPNFRSTSEDHLPRDSPNIQLATRPSSATPDTNKPQRFITRNTVNTNPEDFSYLMDKNPRSRKPIFIQPGLVSVGNSEEKINTTESKKAVDFWKKIDRQNAHTEKFILKKTSTNSPKMFTSHSQVQTNVFLPSVLQDEINNASNTNLMLNSSRSTSPFKPVSPLPPEARVTPIMQDIVKPQKSLDRASQNQVPIDETKRKSSNLEEALDELEAIYNSLRLGDEDLLDRAEQREKESQAKRVAESHVELYPSYASRGALSDSSYSYEPFDMVDSPRRKRMFRKNRTVDIKHDDMAFRKMNKERASTICDPQSAISKVSYLLTSPVHGKGMENEEKERNSHDGIEPDITLDDVVYRNVKHANSLLKVVEPQPPFGIPLGPISLAANSDYLHAKPEDIYSPLFKPRKIPDIVKDDLAFRNLRKDDNKEPALPPLSTEDYRNNNAGSPNLDKKTLRKMRAQRSLSANIGSLMKKQNHTDVDNEFKTLTDIADAMEIARKVLKEKENKISATRKAFMSDSDTRYVHLASTTGSVRESRLNFLNGLRTQTTDQNGAKKPSSPILGDILAAKPPRGLTPERKRYPKESTPIPLSPLEDKKSANSESTSSSLEDLLNALAEEAKETTNRITNELKLLNEAKINKNEEEESNAKKSDELDMKMSEIDAVSEHAKLCEKLLECVVDSADLMASTKVEEVKHIDLEPAVAESANLVLSRIDSEDDIQTKKEDSDHDYENLVSDKELNVEEVEVPNVKSSFESSEKCRSPFEEHKEELVASFQELKQNMNTIQFPCKRDIGKIKGSSKVDSVYDNFETIDKVTDLNDGVTGEEACAGVLDVVALPVEECASTINTNPVGSKQMFTSDCDIILRKFNFIVPDDSESSSGFHSNCSCGESLHYLKSESSFDSFDVNSNTNFDSLESLKSPKLVLETNNKVSSHDSCENPCSISESSKLVKKAAEAIRDNYSKQSDNLDPYDTPTTSHDAERSVYRADSVSRERNNSNRHILDDDDEKPTPSWYRDPTNVAFACSYGIACAHQLAFLDLFAILSIMFAVLSFIAALLL